MRVLRVYRFYVLCGLTLLLIAIVWMIGLLLDVQMLWLTWCLAVSLVVLGVVGILEAMLSRDSDEDPGQDEPQKHLAGTDGAAHDEEDGRPATRPEPQARS